MTRRKGEGGAWRLAFGGYLIGDPHEDWDRAADLDPFVVSADTNPMSAETEREAENGPCLGEAGVDRENAAVAQLRTFSAQAKEPECQRLPYAAHRAQVQPASGRAGEVVEIEPRRHPEEFERPLGLSRTSQQKGGDGRGERAAMRGSRFIKGEARSE
jgi:hypothetical protein